MLFACADRHIPSIALIDPARQLQRLAAVGTDGARDLFVEKRLRAGIISGEGTMLERIRFIGVVLILRKPSGEKGSGVVVLLQSLGKVELGADERRVVGVAERVMRHTGLLNGEVLHRRGEGFLIFVAAGLDVVNELEIDPVCDPVPVKIVDDDVLLHDPPVIVAPGDEHRVLAAPFAEMLKYCGERVAVAEALLVNAGKLFDFVMHAAEVYGPHVGLKFLRGAEIIVELHRADLDDLAAQMDGETVEDRRVGAHSLVPFQVKDNIGHSDYRPFL